MASTIRTALVAIVAPRRDPALRRRPTFPLSWILGVAALTVGCSDKKPEVPASGESPAPKMASPAAPAKAEKKEEPQPEPQAPEKKDNPELPAEPAKPQAPAAQGPSGEESPAKEASDPPYKGLSGKSMLAKVRSTRVSDGAAMKYLEQAQALPDNSAKDRALAANGRGEKLFAQADRADRFFAWAESHYARHPLPSFNRAKLAAIRGEIAQVKTHLKTVKARKGKKLLAKVGFDPTFALVHDDPEVRSLIRSAR